ncbi:MAG: DUF2993 domain-containing protein, partial [Rhodococcus sp. (in: high G+C Gram-positive bacteria)]|nr:DUF2993 domain-containing protein [Rhodococcus sp. (in: high G+C Gram-positive bacteria)]MDX5456054.1 DUF2993 domain-containing protein [Rhodococcus sp. (in: high G+C Gram-positive bacteria)]
AIAIETVDASLFGIGLPTALVDGIVQILTESLQQYPLDMQATSVSVTDSGIAVTLEGGAYTMPEPPAGQQSQNQLDC